MRKTGLEHLSRAPWMVSGCVDKQSSAVYLEVDPKVEVMVEKGELIQSIRQGVLDFMPLQCLVWLI